MFYQYRQNNSGGSFEYDEKRGISVIVVIEATSTFDANEKAMEIGLYWRGCEKGWDCSCCGDRWHELDSSYDKGHKVPTNYGKPIDLKAACDTDNGFSIKWMEGHEGFVHYANGKIVGFWPAEVKKLVKAKAKKKAVKKKTTKKKSAK